MKLIKGEFKERLELQFAQSVRAGFPSLAENYMGESLDFNRDLIRNPEATFYGHVEGDSMMDVGICDGDIAVIDTQQYTRPNSDGTTSKARSWFAPYKTSNSVTRNGLL